MKIGMKLTFNNRNHVSGIDLFVGSISNDF